MLARGEPPPGRPRKDGTPRWTDLPDDLREIVYIDHYSNAMSGLRAAMLPRDSTAGRGRSTVTARGDLQQSASGHGLLVRKF
jgi:S-adenosyl-L-methionine hydrolase (adenosine-forming)